MDAYREALAALLNALDGPGRPVRLPLAQALKRVLATPLHADMDMPPFDRAGVDGFAFRSADAARLPVVLRVSGRIAAGGDPGTLSCAPGEAVRIMTGAPVPSGADVVEMVEKVREVSGDSVEIVLPIQAGRNIARRGSEARAGDLILEKGRIIGPVEAGLLAAFGKIEPEVHPPPRVALVSTGNELVDPEVHPTGGRIRDSNLTLMAAACRSLGVEPWRLTRAGDTLGDMRGVVQDTRCADVLLVSGGLSMGEHDYVRRALELEGARILFHRLPIRPGKPVLGARLDHRIVIGLPGNPVSTLVTFHLFARPVLRRLMGFEDLGLCEARARLRSEAAGDDQRTFFSPALVRLSSTGLEVTPVPTRGSADLKGFAAANSLLVVPAGSAPSRVGDTVTVLLMDDSWATTAEGNL